MEACLFHTTSTFFSVGIVRIRIPLANLSIELHYFSVARLRHHDGAGVLESSFARRLPRPLLSLLGRDIPEDLKIRRSLGFEVTQDENEYKVAVHVPDVAKDIELQLDHDGRVLRLKDDRTHEEGDMKVQFRFEKAILVSPDVMWTLRS